MAHAKLYSASGSKKWMECPGSGVMEDGMPDTTSEPAAWGTVAHKLSETEQTGGPKAAESLGRIIVEDGHQIEVDAEMVEVCDTYIAQVPKTPEGATELLLGVEVKLSFLASLGLGADDMPEGEPDGFGTADYLLVHADEVTGEIVAEVADLKTGRGVAVSPDAPQLKLYALGALEHIERELGVTPDRFTLNIIQPRLYDAPLTEHIFTTDLLEWAKNVAQPAAMAVLRAWDTDNASPVSGALSPEWQAEFLKPSEDGCRWCKAKHSCPALRAAVAEAVSGEADSAVTPAAFENLDATPPGTATDGWLSASLTIAPIIEDWLKAVYAEADRRILTEGASIPGFKVVQGRAGARKWVDPKAARDLLRDVFRLPESAITEAKLKTPTQMLKLAEGEASRIGPRQLAKLEALIIRAEGQPRVVRESDPRKPVTTAKPAEMFDNLETTN